MGSDDYIAKPFGVHGLLTCIAAVLRRTRDLSEREFKLIRHFHAHPDEVLSPDSLLNAAWGMDYYGTTRTLDQHIAQLRKKIEKKPARPELIVTMHGMGYRYESNCKRVGGLSYLL